MSTPPHNRTRLDQFIEENNIPPHTLAEAAGMSADVLDELRREDGDPTLAVMRRVMRACRQLTGRAVGMAELFELGE
jgi:hypothetical protein